MAKSFDLRGGGAAIQLKAIDPGRPIEAASVEIHNGGLVLRDADGAVVALVGGGAVARVGTPRAPVKKVKGWASARQKTARAKRG